ncbi:ABC transporter ATP-binding protein [Roseibium sp. CAU 1637]|uniref:ABC transporter ATP-binding protein n=1 Tax=Roseibium limicola TaxID=2816037 RepID=A0A939EM52_9HYPH|nr:ABC transporter ATP-binding protein [Roseibium limicola]MBO0344357.1 ABC transporter ATP-binding protein [Roseibium limicola]
MTQLAVDVRSLTHSYGDFKALDNVSLAVPNGAYTVLLGPSGSGKTTLLSVLGGFLVPQQGEVLIEGRDMTSVVPAKRPTTTMFQDYALFPHMSIADNVAFGLRMRGVGKKERLTKAMEMLSLVGLADEKSKKPHQLSGGQRQRVALARALAVDPVVLLLDEPLGALDLKLRRQMQSELKAIQREVGTTFVHVTHDQEEAMAIGDEIVVMNKGRIEDLGPPERVYLKPSSRFSAGFMGQSSFVSGTVVSQDPQTLQIDTVFGRLRVPTREQIYSAGSAVVLSMRPEHLVLGTPSAINLSLGTATIRDVTFQGAHHLAKLQHLDASGLELTAQVPQSGHPQVGMEVQVSIHPDHLVILKD